MSNAKSLICSISLRLHCTEKEARELLKVAFMQESMERAKAGKSFEEMEFPLPISLKRKGLSFSFCIANKNSYNDLRDRIDEIDAARFEREEAAYYRSWTRRFYT